MAVIGVNYRGSQDTMECLASLFSGDNVPYVIVADNASGDGSVERIAAWARGEVATPVGSPFHAEAAQRLITFPIDYEIIGPDELARGIRKPLTIIQTGKNWGFAGGNNRGLELALATAGVELFWLLNNDTIVTKTSVSAVKEAFAENPDWGMAGTQLRLYHEPERFQMVNGQRFNSLTAASKGIMAGWPVSQSFDAADIAAQTDFVCGASLVMTRQCLSAIGLLEQDFFLYFEEIDLARRLKHAREKAGGAQGLAIGFAAEAVVYHKEGATAGSGSQLAKGPRSPLAEYHLIRSKMIFARKHHPLLVPLYTLQNGAIVLRRMLRGHWPQARAVLRASVGLPLN